MARVLATQRGRDDFTSGRDGNPPSSVISPRNNADGDAWMLARFVKRMLNESMTVSCHSDAAETTSKAIVNRLSASDPANGTVPCHM